MSGISEHREKPEEGNQDVTQDDERKSLFDTLKLLSNGITDEEALECCEILLPPANVSAIAPQAPPDSVASYTDEASSSSASLQVDLNCTASSLVNANMPLQTSPSSPVVIPSCHLAFNDPLPIEESPPPTSSSSDPLLPLTSTTAAPSSKVSLVSSGTPATAFLSSKAHMDFAVSASSSLSPPTAAAAASNTAHMAGVSTLSGRSRKRTYNNKKFKGLAEEEAAKRRLKLNEEERKRQQLKSDAYKRLAKVLKRGHKFSSHRDGSQIHTIATATREVLLLQQLYQKLVSNGVLKGNATGSNYQIKTRVNTTQNDVFEVLGSHAPTDHAEVTLNTMNPSNVFSGNDASTYPANSLVNTSNTNTVFTLPVQTSQIQQSGNAQLQVMQMATNGNTNFIPVFFSNTAPNSNISYVCPANMPARVHSFDATNIVNLQQIQGAGSNVLAAQYYQNINHVYQVFDQRHQQN